MIIVLLLILNAVMLITISVRLKRLHDRVDQMWFDITRHNPSPVAPGEVWWRPEPRRKS